MIETVTLTAELAVKMPGDEGQIESQPQPNHETQNNHKMMAGQQSHVKVLFSRNLL